MKTDIYERVTSQIVAALEQGIRLAQAVERGACGGADYAAFARQWHSLSGHQRADAVGRGG
jgi:hypothetical protein